MTIFQRSKFGNEPLSERSRGSAIAAGPTLKLGVFSMMKRPFAATAVSLVLSAGLAGAAFAQGYGSPGTSGTQGNPPAMEQTAPTVQQPSSTETQTPASPGMSSGNPSTAPGMSSSEAGNPSRATVQEAQQQLKSQGLYDGPVDGKLGAGTRDAIRKYQQQNGLSETAQLDAATLQHLLK